MSETPSTVCYVYIVRCADRSLYTGIARDVDARVCQHNDGSGAKYTRGRRPVTLVYIEEIKERGLALQREHEIKRMSATSKRALIRSRIDGRKS